MGAGEPGAVCCLGATSQPAGQHAKVPKIVLKLYIKRKMESLRKVVLDIPVLSCSRISPALLQRDGEVGAGCWWDLMM